MLALYDALHLSAVSFGMFKINPETTANSVVGIYESYC